MPDETPRITDDGEVEKLAQWLDYLGTGPKIGNKVRALGAEVAALTAQRDAAHEALAQIDRRIGNTVDPLDNGRDVRLQCRKIVREFADRLAGASPVAADPDDDSDIDDDAMRRAVGLPVAADPPTEEQQ